MALSETLNGEQVHRECQKVEAEQGKKWIGLLRKLAIFSRTIPKNLTVVVTCRKGNGGG